MGGQPRCWAGGGPRPENGSHHEALRLKRIRLRAGEQRKERSNPHALAARRLLQQQLLLPIRSITRRSGQPFGDQTEGLSIPGRSPTVPLFCRPVGSALQEKGHM